jgi:hypothetical protein
MEELMDNSELEKFAGQLTSIWMRAFEEKRFHDALVTAFASFLISREMKYEDLEPSFLAAMRAAIERLLPSDSSAKKDECSFCGRHPPDVRLAAGPNAFICDACVTMFSQMFPASN